MILKDATATGNLTEAQTKAKYKAANNILEANTTFLSSLANGCNKKDNGATTINGTVNLSGTWTETTITGSTEILMALPGSNWMDFEMDRIPYVLNGKTVPAYPAYNERLGTFALMETPSVNLWSRTNSEVETQLNYNGVASTYRTYSVSYRIEPASDLKFVFNPKLNVDNEKTDISVRYVIKQDIGPSVNGINFFDKYIKDIHRPSVNLRIHENSVYKVSTPFIPIDQYKNMAPLIFANEENTFVPSPLNHFPGHRSYPKLNYNDSLFIQFKIHMVSNDAGKDGEKISAVYYFAFPVNVIKNDLIEEFSPYPPYPILADYTTYEEYLQAEDDWVQAKKDIDVLNQMMRNKIVGQFSTNKPSLEESANFNQDINFTENKILAYDGIVFISAKLSTSPGKKVTIYSVLGFELEPGAELSPDIELIVGYPYQVEPIPPQTFTQVSAFCADNNKYKAKEFTATAIKMEQEEYARREEARKEELKRQNQLHFQLFPNPTNDVVNIRFDAGITENVQVEVVDIAGKTVYTTVLNKGEQSYPLSLGHLVKGMYFVHLYKGEVKAAKKLVLH